MQIMLASKPIKVMADCLDNRLDGYKPMTEHDWPQRRLYEALATRDACAEVATGVLPRCPEPSFLHH